jgi:hypothetical protein
MLLENLKEVCALLCRLEQAEGKTLTYSAIIGNTHLTQKEIISLFTAMEEEGCLSCTGRNYWDEPRGYHLLRTVKEITLYEVMTWSGMETIFSGFPGETLGGRKLKAAATRLQSDLKQIYVNEI